MKTRKEADEYINKESETSAENIFGSMIIDFIYGEEKECKHEVNRITGYYSDGKAIIKKNDFCTDCGKDLKDD